MDPLQVDSDVSKDETISEPTADAAEPTSGSGQSSTIYVALLLVGLAAVAAFFWSRQQKQLEAAEAAAKPKIQQLGGLVLSGDSGQHVGSVNLALVREQKNFDEAIQLIPDLPWLKVLDLTGNSITGEQLKLISRLKELTSLHLANTTIDDSMTVHLEGLSSLTALHVPGTNITNKSLDSIGRLAGLEVLDLSDTQITGNLSPLTKLSKLHWLVLKNVSLQDDSLATLSELPTLKRLTLAKEQITQQQYKNLKQQRPGLRIDGMDPEVEQH